MNALVRAFDWKAVRDALRDTPSLAEARDGRGRNWLHLCCSVDPEGHDARTKASVKTAGVLVDAGIDPQAPASRERDWLATPLWYAISRGRNRMLARWLLERGVDPEHCMWAAAFSDDVAAVRLLARYGATLDPVHEGATPFFFAVQWSRFAGARALLELGANVDFQDARGRTALHLVLKKDSGIDVVRLLLDYGARPDLPDRDGVTARTLLAKRRDPAYRRLAEVAS
jgi:catechol 2,3-dioxygenase-like lactoylglutathione lyase family enzyme